MIKFLSSEDFRFLWLPIITTILTILIKIFYKDKQLSWFSWSDFSIAPNLMVTSIFIFLIKMSFIALDVQNSTEQAQTQKLTENLFTQSLVFSALLVGMMGLTWIIRERGWQKKNHVGELRLKPKYIVITDIVGAFYLIISYNY